MRELTIKPIPTLHFKNTFSSIGKYLVKTFQTVKTAIDNHFYEVDQFHRRLDQAKDENFRKFWPYYIR